MSMTMAQKSHRINLHKIADLTDNETIIRRALAKAVYPPESVANWPGRSIEWTPAQWCIMYWGDEDEALSHTGIIIREGKADQKSVKIGGIGGVMTHPQARKQGLASQVIERAFEFFLQQEVDFALLVCEPPLITIYEKMGWQAYKGDLLVTQQQKPCKFTFNMPMVRSVRTDISTSNVIDLLGPPW
jgi:aminoglycoside 2'-N-acetyltransferase I